MSHERNVAKEIRDKYIDTMNKIYYSYFKAYSSRIMKLQVRRFSDYFSDVGNLLLNGCELKNCHSLV